MLEVYYHTDIRALLPAIRARTAVLHREADKGTRFELGREVAALIPGATLIPLPGSSHLFYHGDWPAVLDAALGFESGIFIGTQIGRFDLSALELPEVEKPGLFLIRIFEGGNLFHNGLPLQEKRAQTRAFGDKAVLYEASVGNGRSVPNSAGRPVTVRRSSSLPMWRPLVRSQRP